VLDYGASNHNLRSSRLLNVVVHGDPGEAVRGFFFLVRGLHKLPKTYTVQHYVGVVGATT